MRKTVSLCVFFFFAFTAFAKTVPADSVSKPKSRFFNNFTIGLPMSGINYCNPLKEKALGNLPESYKWYMCNAKNTVGAIPLLYTNYSIRFFGLFYKDKIGMEFYWNGFGANIDNDHFSKYLEARYPGYYISANQEEVNKIADYKRAFSGPEIVAGYLCHIHTFIISPKLGLGFESQKINMDHSLTMLKDVNSNQFIEYSIDQSLVKKSFQHSYHAQLSISRRFGKGVFKPEAGIKLEYIYAPYDMQVRITEQPFSQPATITEFQFHSAFQMIKMGIFANLVLGKTK